MLHHSHVLRGGFFGVDLFFVLSGFLISTLLLEEWVDRGTISLRRFYARRALRLMPAVLVYLGVLFVAAVVVGDSAAFPGLTVRNATVGAVQALAYVYNWAAVFQMNGAWREMGQLWSLSIEEQYYFLWPGALLLMLRSRMQRGTLIAVVATLTLLTASLPVVVPGWGVGPAVQRDGLPDARPACGELGRPPL